jgi:hypothetical protein
VIVRLTCAARVIESCLFQLDMVFYSPHDRDSRPSGGIVQVSITPVQPELLASGGLLEPLVLLVPGQLLKEEVTNHNLEILSG